MGQAVVIIRTYLTALALRAAAQTGMDRQTLRDWAHRYNEAGIEGLRSRRSPGRAAVLAARRR